MAGRARRAELVARIPADYSGVRHFATLIAGASAALAVCIAFIEPLRWYEWLFVPAFVVFANGFEWWIHRGPMHHKTRWLPVFYERHTLTHHVIFLEDDMGVESLRELRVVLFPAWALPLFAAMVAPVFVAIGLAVDWNLALVFYASALGYYVLYECFHTMHHLPADHPIARTRLAAWLRRCHAKHHDPRRMSAGNFNVSFPLWDWILGSRLA